MLRSASLNASRRARELEELASGASVDVLVIGGGVTGTGAALDAATRGLSVALIERRDLAWGTSRWSSKLVHGGLRYLAKGDVGIAYESALERGILMEKTAPHLVRALPFVMPVGTATPRRSAVLAAAGFAFGDLLRLAARTSRSTLPRPRWIAADEALRLAPALRAEGLDGALLSYDGQLVDDARLVVGIARTAAGFGARILTYCRAERADGAGADVVDERSGRAFRLRARHVVNATGVWADTLAPQVQLTPSKGAHLVLSAARLGHPRAAVTVPVPGTLSRFVFLLPQADGRVYLGLTDEPATRVEDVPAIDEADRELLLRVASRALETTLTSEDVIGSYAGLRPLVRGAEGATADLSREHAIFESESGLLTIVGGKLTTYRKMAEDVVDRLDTSRPCVTKTTPLVGASERLDAIDAPPHLLSRYGAEAPLVMALGEARPALRERVLPSLPYRLSELRFAIEHEGALTAEDLVDRRTRIGLASADRDAALSVAEAMIAETR